MVKILTISSTLVIIEMQGTIIWIPGKLNSGMKF